MHWGKVDKCVLSLDVGCLCRKVAMMPTQICC